MRVLGGGASADQLPVSFRIKPCDIFHFKLPHQQGNRFYCIILFFSNVEQFIKLKIS